jgi:predicted NAD-dependent protein-ADP-ribosyltransferase YbiA (DUF1768 family)
MQKILGFTNDYKFLSNDHPCEIMFDGLTYPSVTHAFAAARTDDPEVREQIRNLLDAATVRSFVKRIPETTFFKGHQLEIMTQLLQSKFFDSVPLAQKLHETADWPLIHLTQRDGTFTRGDEYWGVVKTTGGFRGQNWLGHILMALRSQIQVAAMRSADARMAKVRFSGGLTPSDSSPADNPPSDRLLDKLEANGDLK